MAVEVTFRMQVELNAWVGEQDLAADLGPHLAALLANDQSYGELIIRSEGQPEVSVDDEMWSTVANVCFVGVAELLAGREVVNPYMRYNGEVRLTPEGERVRVSGDFIPTAVYERRELLPALHECGRRYVKFLRRLGEEAGVAVFVETSERLEQLDGMKDFRSEI